MFSGFLEIFQIVWICRHFGVFLTQHQNNPVRMTYEVIVTVLVFGRYLCRRKTRHHYIVTIRGANAGLLKTLM